MIGRGLEVRSGGLSLVPGDEARVRRESSQIYSFPFILVLAYFFVDYGRPQDWFSPLGAIRPSMIVMGTSALVLVLSGRMSFPPLVRLVLVYLALMALMVPFAVNHRLAFNKTWEFLILILGALLPIVAFTDSIERLEKLIGFYVWIHVPLALFSLTHKGTGVGSFLTDENDFALAMNIALPYAVALLILAKSVARRLFLLAAITLFLAAIVATASRGGFIGLVSVAVMLWFRSRRKLRGLVGVVCLAFVFVLVSRSLTTIGRDGQTASYWDRMMTIDSAAEEGDTGKTRLEMWAIGWNMFKDNPILGVGPGNYPHRAAEYETEYMTGHGRHAWGRVAHSVYFTLLPESGLAGTLVFVSIIVLGWHSRRQVQKRCRQVARHPTVGDSGADKATTLGQFAAAMDVALVTFLVTGVFLSVLYYPHVWLLTAMTATLVAIANTSLPTTIAQPAASGR
jgi:probable O-glycosylation ligase (exosortase A-associated)